METTSSAKLTLATLKPPAGTTSTSSNPAAPWPPELVKANEQFLKQEAEQVTALYEAGLANLNKEYAATLTKAVAAASRSGNMDGKQALQAEIGFIRGQPVPDNEPENTPAAVKNLRAIYRTAQAKLVATRAANLKKLTAPLDKRLIKLEADLTKADRLSDAKAVRTYREALMKSSPGR